MTDQQEKANSPRGIFEAIVRTNRQLCDEHFLLRLNVPAHFPPTKPGQFVQVACNEHNEAQPPVVHEWDENHPPHLRRPELVGGQTLLRRPFSLAGREQIDGQVVLDIIHRVIGRGSAWLSRLATGDKVSLLGPLGNSFTWTADIRQAILVGGGVGLPPMLYLAETLHKAGVPAVAFVGAMSHNLLPFSIDQAVGCSQSGWPTLCVREFARWATETAVTTDDGSVGTPGRVTEALWNWIDQGRIVPEQTRVFTCGPEPMMKAVALGCIRRNISCQVAMERKMACGMGTCQSCVCKIKADEPQGWQYKLVCTDGTVFDARDLVLD